MHFDLPVHIMTSIHLHILPCPYLTQSAISIWRSRSSQLALAIGCSQFGIRQNSQSYQGGITGGRSTSQGNHWGADDVLFRSTSPWWWAGANHRPSCQVLTCGATNPFYGQYRSSRLADIPTPYWPPIRSWDIFEYRIFCDIVIWTWITKANIWYLGKIWYLKVFP